MVALIVTMVVLFVTCQLGGVWEVGAVGRPGPSGGMIPTFTPTPRWMTPVPTCTEAGSAVMGPAQPGLLCQGCE